MLVQFRRRLVIDFREWEDKVILCLEASGHHEVGLGSTNPPSYLPYFSLPALGKKVDADLVFQPLLCVSFFVAELTWLDFPSEVITYLFFPHKICFLKSWPPLALSFLRTERGSSSSVLLKDTPCAHDARLLIHRRRQNSCWCDVSVKASLKIA